jgi:hypothetical protein
MEIRRSDRAITVNSVASILSAAQTGTEAAPAEPHLPANTSDARQLYGSGFQGGLQNFA